MYHLKVLVAFLCIAACTNAFLLPGSTWRSHRSSLASLEMVNTKNINMPALSSTMTEGKVVSWNKKVGDKISSGDVVLVVESDKADMDVESYEEGYLAKIITPEGGSAAVGSAVAILVADKADIGNVGNAAPSATSSAPVAPATPVASTTTSSAPAGQAPNGMSSIMMPALSSTMKEGKIVSWSKKVGDKISSGDVALVVESDKADMDVESYEDGFVAAILVKDGESAEVGKPVALIAKTKEAIPSIQEYAAAMNGGGLPAQPVASASTGMSTPASPAATTVAPVILNDGRIVASGYAQAQAKAQNIDLRTIAPSRPDGYITSKDLSGATPGAPAAYTPTPGTINATPSARKYASENGIDLTKVKGSGNFGRVTGDDVLIAAGKKTVPAPEPVAAVAAPASPKPAGAATASSAPSVVLDGVKPMDGMQKAVAKNMEKTLSVPIFRVSREIVTDNFDVLYAQLKPKGVTVSAMLAKAVAEVLKKHPIINAAYVEGGIKYNKDVNVAMAVAIDGGLITPTIIKAQEQDLFSISRVWKELVEKAKSKKLTPAEYSSGTFTISNLGMFGVQQFDAILPPGTGSILAIAASTPKVVQLKNGHFGVQKSMTVTITSDHRHIYGADAAEFLKDLADLLENNVQSLLMG